MIPKKTRLRLEPLRSRSRHLLDFAQQFFWASSTPRVRGVPLTLVKDLLDDDL